MNQDTSELIQLVATVALAGVFVMTGWHFHGKYMEGELDRVMESIGPYERCHYNKSCTLNLQEHSRYNKLLKRYNELMAGHS